MTMGFVEQPLANNILKKKLVAETYHQVGYLEREKMYTTQSLVFILKFNPALQEASVGD